MKLQDGTYAAYDAVCTHEGCKVGWDAQDGVMLCPCHGAAFDPNDHGAVLQGPTNTPLPELPIVVDQQAGTITLRAGAGADLPLQAAPLRGLEQELPLRVTDEAGRRAHAVRPGGSGGTATISSSAEPSGDRPTYR